jgi:hypothetical protein
MKYNFLPLKIGSGLGWSFNSVAGWIGEWKQNGFILSVKAPMTEILRRLL